MSRRKPRFTPDPPPYNATGEQILAWVNAQLLRIEDYWPRDDGERISALEELQGALTGEWSISGQSNVRFEGTISEEVLKTCSITTATLTATYSTPRPSNPALAFGISDDGTKLFTQDQTALTPPGGGNFSRVIREWALSTPYDVDSASSVQVLYPAANGGAGHQEITVSPSGDIVILADNVVSSENVTVRKLSLSTPWSLTGVAESSTTVTLGATGSANSSAVSPDGKYLYIGSNVGTGLRMWEMATAWDITSLSLIGDITLPTGWPSLYIPLPRFDPSANNIFVCPDTSELYRWPLSTPGDLRTTGSRVVISLTNSGRARDVSFLNGSCDDLLVMAGIDASQVFTRHDAT